MLPSIKSESNNDLADFMMVTECKDEAIARQYLEKFPSLEIAMDEYFASGGSMPQCKESPAQLKSDPPNQKVPSAKIQEDFEDLANNQLCNIKPKNEENENYQSNEAPRTRKSFVSKRSLQKESASKNPDPQGLDSYVTKVMKVANVDETAATNFLGNAVAACLKQAAGVSSPLGFPPNPLATGFNRPALPMTFNQNFFPMFAPNQIFISGTSDLVNAFRGGINRLRRNFNHPFNFDNDEEGSFDEDEDDDDDDGMGFNSYPAAALTGGQRPTLHQVLGRLRAPRLPERPPLLELKGNYEAYVKPYLPANKSLFQNKAAEWPKFLGSLLVDCLTASSKSLSDLDVGDKVRLEAQEIEFRESNVYKTVNKKRTVVGHNYSIQGRSLQVNVMRNDKEIGRLNCLDAEIFVFLLEKKYIIAEGYIVEPNLEEMRGNSMATIKVQLNIFLTKEIIKNPINYQQAQIGRRALSRMLENKTESKEEQQRKQKQRFAKEAMIKLFQMLQVKVTIPTIVKLKQRFDPFQRIKHEKSKRLAKLNKTPARVIKNDFRQYYKDRLPEERDALVQEGSNREGQEDNDSTGTMHVESETEKFDGESDTEAPLYDFEDGSDCEDGEESKREERRESLISEGTNQTNQDMLDTTKVSNYYKATQPPGTMKTKLHVYQQQALSWMKFREGVIGEEELYATEVPTRRKLEDLFQEMVLLNGSKLYFNPFNGEVAADFPKTNPCRGGILADEMGLGKTVMTISLLHSHKRGQIVRTTVIQEERKQREENSGPSFVEKVKEKKQLVEETSKIPEEKKIQKADELFEELFKFKSNEVSKSASHKRKFDSYENGQKQDKKEPDVALKKVKLNEVVPKKADAFDDFDDLISSLTSRKPVKAEPPKAIPIKNMKPKPEEKKKEEKKEEKKQTTINDDAPFKFGKKKEAKAAEVRYAETLIIVPVSVMSQWENEILKHSNANTISVFQYYGDGRKSKDLTKYNVVLTTYGTVESAYKKHLKGDNKDGDGLFQYDWFRVILDEAHNIKSRLAKTTKAVAALPTEYRWCLTGTPLQNKLDDMFSLFHFLKMNTWGDYFWWNTYINKHTSYEESSNLIRTLLQPIILRRTKKSTYMDGSSIIELPSKHSTVKYVTLTEQERKLYNFMFKKSKAQFDELVEDNKINNEYIHVLKLITRLRQLCDHHCLVFKKEDLRNQESVEKAVLKFLEKNNPRSVGNAIEEELEEGAEGTEGKEKNSLLDSEFIQKTLERLKKKELEACSICFEEISEAGITSCGHIFCKNCITMTYQRTKACPLCQNALEVKNIMFVSMDSLEEGKEGGLGDNSKRSSKLLAVVEATKEVRKKKEKVVIFSQFVQMMNLIEKALNQEGMTCERIDGSCSLRARERSIEIFSQDPNATVLLVSLKAGGVGLNLTMATNVYLVDPWWNPAMEEQAIERIHRIGQTKSVNVIRFICAKTIEIRMQELKEKKMALVKDILQYNPQEQKEQNIQNMIHIMQGFDDDGLSDDNAMELEDEGRTEEIQTTKKGCF